MPEEILTSIMYLHPVRSILVIKKRIWSTALIAVLVFMSARSLGAAANEQTLKLVAISCAQEHWRVPKSVKVVSVQSLRTTTLTMKWSALSQGVYAAEARLPIGYYSLYLRSGVCHTTDPVDFALVAQEPRHIVATMAAEYVLADRQPNALVVTLPSEGFAVSLVQKVDGRSKRVHPRVDSGIIYFDNLPASNYSLVVGTGTWISEIPLDLRKATPGSLTTKRVSFEEIMTHVKH